jgi:hypothetical protein
MRLSESSMDKLYDLMVSSLIFAPKSPPPDAVWRPKFRMHARERAREAWGRSRE